MAVGITPEMLLMIVTINLAKGAVKMSKYKKIVKNLNSIQNFGAMDEKVDEIPFDFARCRMSVVLQDKNEKTQLI